MKSCECSGFRWEGGFSVADTASVRADAGSIRHGPQAADTPTESRRAARFFKMGHTGGRMQVRRECVNPEFPLTLDLRRG